MRVDLADEGMTLLAAALLERAVLDARKGDAGARAWLLDPTGPMALWAALLDVEPAIIAERAEATFSREKMETPNDRFK